MNIDLGIVSGVRNRIPYSSKQIVSRIREYDTVSFDVFDTLVKRSVASPSDIFEITAMMINARYQSKLDPLKFKRDRQAAATAAKQKASRENREEILLSEIYACLDSSYSSMMSTLQNTEIQQEINACYPNRIIKKVYDWCVNNNKRIILVSDMYLPLAVIEEILHKCGYLNNDKIYLSSAIGMTKKTGNLVKIVCESEPNKNIVHIGDSFKSDYVEFKKHGLHSVLISSSPDFTTFSRDHLIKKGDAAAYHKLKSILSSQSDPQDSLAYKYGLECEGPLLYGFSLWLYQRLVDGQFDKVFFLARDGYLMKKVFDILFDESPIKSVYLHVSRRSVHVPLLWQYSNLNDYLLLNGENKRWNVVNLTNRLGLDLENSLVVWKACGLPEDFTFKTKEIDQYDGLLTFFEKIKAKAYENSKAEYVVFKKYLEAHGFSGRIAIVDSGGNATTQRCLEKYLENERDNSDVKGFYLWCNAEKSIDYESFPVSTDVVGGETVLAELPLTPPEGTTINYIHGSGDIIPVLDAFEFEGIEDTKQIIDDVQRGCLHFAKTMKKNCNYLVLDRDVTYHNSMLVSRYPTLSHVNYFGDLMFRSDQEDVYMARPDSIVYYLLHPKSLLREMRHVKWKMGFLKRLLKIPFPYYHLVKFLRKV